MEHLTRTFHISERRACAILGQPRSTQRYRGTETAAPAITSTPTDAQLIQDISELAARHPRFGYRRIWSLLRARGILVNRKRVQRLWRLRKSRQPDANRGSIG